MTIQQIDRESARQFISDEWPSWDADHQTVSAALIVALSEHRERATAPLIAALGNIVAGASIDWPDGDSEFSAYCVRAARQALKDATDAMA